MAELAPDPALSATAIHAMSHPGLASADESGMTANAFMLTLFEGNLFTASGTEGGFSNLPQGENDFTPLLLALQSADSGSWLMGVHMMPLQTGPNSSIAQLGGRIIHHIFMSWFLWLKILIKAVGDEQRHPPFIRSSNRVLILGRNLTDIERL